MKAADTARPAFDEASLATLVGATLRDLHPGTLGLPPIEPSSRLDRDLGFDSLGRMELLLRIEAAAGVALAEDTLARAETVADLWQAVRLGRSGPGLAGEAALRSPATQAAQAWPQPPLGDAAPPTEAPWLLARTLLEVLDAHLQVHPDRVQVLYLADGMQTPLTYRRIAEGADTFAAAFQRAGLQPRETVAIMLPTSPEYFFTYLGILRAGGIPVPIYPPARPSQLEDHVRRHTGILSNARCACWSACPRR
jgi:acyl carrier protein